MSPPVIYTHDVDSAYRIFTSLNVPGMPLTPVEYLKAAVFGKLKESLQSRGYELHMGYWTSAERALKKPEIFSELLDHIYRIEAVRRADTDGFLSSFASSLAVTSSYHQYMFNELKPELLTEKLDQYSGLFSGFSERQQGATASQDGD
ncbi:hypothetical protein HDU85_001635 [Gaertneriomyces sp. JEL0708]|nr:hypothetical protein HDU85_001635 [Gaertneriomyces sp. JEL0708]